MKKILSIHESEEILRSEDPLVGISEDDNTKMYEHCSLLPTQVKSEISTDLHIILKDFHFDQFAIKAVAQLPYRRIYSMYVNKDNIEQFTKTVAQNLYLAYKVTNLNEKINDKVDQLYHTLTTQFSSSSCQQAIIEIIVGTVKETLHSELSEIFDFKFKTGLENAFYIYLKKFFESSLYISPTFNIFDGIEIVAHAGID